MLWRLVHSPLGRVFLAIRENELRCRFLGYRVTWYKLLVVHHLRARSPAWAAASSPI
jgi:ABC-type branched-subunit amino acid transport system permease subunit